ncbi:MAG TPA: CpsD/CapB family tyrosine-protein kinase [Ilumatobacter sp.]|nr:CpsD/CapB family tyrosine-protein kinase [Ilumatobacter sp.]
MLNIPFLSKGRQPDFAASAEQGGLLIVGSNGQPLHLVPPKVAAELRFLVARLQANPLDIPPSLAVTSALSGEGVTFVARSLAALVAHDLNRSVCVIETNWWRAATRRRSAPVEQRAGLAEVLAGVIDLDDALVTTNDSRLSILPAGQAPLARRPVIVASDAFSAVIRKIAARFDMVVVDCPPVLKASEAITICRQCESAILVVRHGVTSERQVRQAIHELAGVDVLGLLLNGSATRVPRSLRRFTVDD